MERKEFVVNPYLKLKLKKSEYGEKFTSIFVNNKKIMICASIVMDIPKDKMDSVKKIQSIDEFIEAVGKESTHKGTTSDLSPEEEFWGHCSQIEAWYEYNYDSQLLDSRIAFPLLRELKEFDPRAKTAYKEEALKRYNFGSDLVHIRGRNHRITPS